MNSMQANMKPRKDMNYVKFLTFLVKWKPESKPTGFGKNAS